VGPRAGLDRCENLAPARIRSPDRPARSQSLYRLSYRAHETYMLNFFLVPNQQSQYSAFHKLMCWHSLTFRLSNVMSPLQRGDLLYRVTVRIRDLKPNYPDHGQHEDPPLSGEKNPMVEPGIEPGTS
jgi:hypothetical protein